jgi:SOS-response transcriptional repressor LexA
VILATLKYLSPDGEKHKSGTHNAYMDIQAIRRANLTRLFHRLSPDDVTGFGKIIGKSQSATSDLLLGRKSFGEKMARSIEKNAGWVSMSLDLDERSSNTSAGPAITQKVPLISWVQAGSFREVIDIYEPGVAEDWIPSTVPIRSHTYALRVVGDSMEPDFPAGTILIVEPEMEWHHGSFVIVRNDDHEATFKQIVKDGADWYLKPLNPRYPIRLMSEDDHVCGVVRAGQRSYC